MKVWINKRNTHYSGGMIIVAANSAEEAHKTLQNDPEYNLYHKNIDGNYPDYYYKSGNWEEISNLIYNGDKPRVIVEHSYTE